MPKEIKVIYKMIDAPKEVRDAKLIEGFKMLIEASSQVRKEVPNEPERC